MVRPRMAGRRRDEEDEIPEDKAPEAKTPPRPQRSGVVMWIEDQWEGWLKSVGTIILFAIAYVLYKFDLVGEGLAGAGLVLAVVLGGLGSVALPAWPLVRSASQKYLFVTVMAVAALASGYPALRAALPPKALTEGRLTTAQPSATFKVAGDGPYEISVGGGFKQAGGEAEASYTIKATGNGSDEVSGSLKRSMQRLRTSRRGGTSTTIVEHTENVHRLDHVRGSELTLAAEGVDEQLAEGLLVEIRNAGPNPLFFIILGVLAILGALALDTRLFDAKGKTKGYLAVGAGLVFAFGMYFPTEATPHSLVRPGVSALVFALGVGALPGWILGALARVFFAPKIKKPARR
jgi:hypothetical protein